jgi:hypothetical protein
VYTLTVNTDRLAGAVETMEYTVDLEARPTKQLGVKLAGIERRCAASL